MQPKNKSERTKAFVNFLLLFLLSVAIIITTVFFSIQVPIKQNDDLRKKNYIVQRDRIFASDFLTEMSAITGMLDTINTKALKYALLDGTISESITKLNLKVEADSIYDKNLYKNVVQNLYELQAAKKQLRELSAKDYDVNELKTEIENSRRELQQCEIMKNSLNQQLSSLTNQRR